MREALERAENVVLVGPSGTGKTHLAIVFGLIAARRRRVSPAVEGAGYRSC
jgi:DNA replication protein DnaC